MLLLLLPLLLPLLLLLLPLLLLMLHRLVLPENRHVRAVDSFKGWKLGMELLVPPSRLEGMPIHNESVCIVRSCG
jgi:hypothetical protein